jgi:transposase
MCQSRPWLEVKEEPVEKHTVAAVDIAKSIFEVAVSFLVFFAQMPAATIVMEACGSAHYWARKLQELGHTVVLLPPHQCDPT